jgi:tyrosine-protein phosphatase SIW14
MNKILLLLISMLLISSPVLSGESRLRPDNWGAPIISENLDNWFKVDNLVYRSEQPSEKGMVDIERFGIRRVLNLREFHSDNDETQGTNLKTFHIPIKTSKIKDKDVIKALKIIKSSDQPILVHCWHGSDRTGTIVAMYRIVEQGWSKAAALDELVNGGYGYHAIYGNIPEYINSVDIDFIRPQTRLR